MKISRRYFLWSSVIVAASSWVLKVLNLFTRGPMALEAAPLPAGSNFSAAPRTGMLPARVVSVFSAGAMTWSEKYPYVDTIDHAAVRTMLDEGLKHLTGEKSRGGAWRAIFPSFQPGDMVAIKPNFNDLYKEFRENLVTSPAVLNAILAGMVDALSIPPADIVVYDCTRKIPDAYRRRIHYQVRYVESYGSSFLRKVKHKLTGNPLARADRRAEIAMTRAVTDNAGNPVRCYLPEVVTRARHIVNVPVFKSHQFVLASGALKNHYGTVRFSDGITGPLYLHPPIIHESIADVNAHPQISEKTRLVVMDAIFGRLNKKGGAPDPWLQFDGNHPRRLFVSRDPVALDSVTSHLAKIEMTRRNEEYRDNQYLKLAAQKGLGTFEEPDGQGRFRRIDFTELAL